MRREAATAHSPWPFLAVRRGLPLLVAALALVAAWLRPEYLGWFLVVAVAGAAEVWPTFKRGETYLRQRRTIVRKDGLWAYAFLPVARFFRREESWILSFCAWNNVRVRQVFQSRQARNAVVLLPHCIQLSRCKADVISDLKACYECGLCTVEDILAGTLTKQWNVRLTNRSHKAYREARELRPDLIVAVSCADRLLKGLTRLAEVPSYVIPLHLPHGMCVDTTFRVDHLTEAMAALVKPR
ncbi:MAG: DUF116 domain-containing protein, partial [Firmicutes bacterium]|nr:DUF116 domain-containing protein [Bacillota bacterium]